MHIWRPWAPQNELANSTIGTIATGSSYRTNQGAALERHCMHYRHFIELVNRGIWRGRHATILLVVFTLEPK